MGLKCGGIQILKLNSIAVVELPLEMLPLVFQLTLCDSKGNARSFCGDLRRIEIVPSCGCFVGNSPQVPADRLNRISAFLKTLQLRMKSISFRLAKQDFLSEQPFPPQGDQAHAIEERRM